MNSIATKLASVRITDDNTITLGVVCVLLAFSFAVGGFIEGVYYDRRQTEVWRSDVMELFDRLEQNQQRLIEIANDSRLRLDQIEASNR